MPISDYTIGKPKYGERSWHRYDLYRPTGNHDFVHLVGPDDLSPIFNGKYFEHCPCCWLGFAHSENYHAAALAQKGE